MTITPAQRAALVVVCRDRHVARLSVFGSRATGQPRNGSDLDLLVEFEPGKAPGFFGLAELADQLSLVLGGLRVDLRTPGDLSRVFRNEVVNAAQEIYAS